MRLMMLAAMVLLLAACGRNAKPDVPRGVIVQPKVITVTRTVYVDVPANLTPELPIAEGPLSMCPDVAAERAKTIRTANANAKAIRALSGTEVKP